ncbi:hypothetical protein GW17_00040230 [Ensete ventricosum]|uniref:Uncharacterized protein n=1 Tax=Ensete ventricosum TaxID=4639 RepID=A0A444DFV9_ENSVE|nr:hypothetical protein GW17_00040230 [Ensete ventricosum]RZR71914.1 hypothetical protein BHM03_00008724 [Ensete ventricosum]
MCRRPPFWIRLLENPCRGCRCESFLPRPLSQEPTSSHESHGPHLLCSCLL